MDRSRQGDLKMSLKILVVSVEVAPYAKVGGLADVASSLPVELKNQGHDVKILMPGYGLAERAAPNPVNSVVAPFDVKVNKFWKVRSTLKETDWQGVPVWLLNGEGLFDGIVRSEDVYTPGRDAYLYFAKATLEACEQAGWIPDVIHCNDWHTGFLPVVLRELGGEKWSQTASVYTIHNLAYQGEFQKDTLTALDLPEKLFNMHQLETYGGVNFLKSGCVFADQVNTVSPNYAEEIQTEEFGCRQWGLMRDLAKLGRLRGILNGIDVDFFNPETDEYLPSNFGLQSGLQGKAKCKAELQKELGLPVEAGVPMLSAVSRLSDQKGFDHMIRAAYGLLGFPAQWVILAVGDPGAAAELRKLEAEWPDRFRFVERFDAPLAQKIYAGSDIFLMPSAFEPCGLGQLIAMRYGTVPVVRRTGGLADTVREPENGFVFEHRSPRGLFDATQRAVSAYRDPQQWSQIVENGMRGDYGWESSARKYVEMYQAALASRKTAIAIG